MTRGLRGQGVRLAATRPWLALGLLVLAGCLGASPPAGGDGVALARPDAPAAPGLGTTVATPATPALVDRSCRIDEDCVVKDVGSCCGVRPACVNRSATVDAAAVAAACKASGRMSTCGFQVVSGCSCNAGQCRARRDTVGEWLRTPAPRVAASPGRVP